MAMLNSSWWINTALFSRMLQAVCKGLLEDALVEGEITEPLSGRDEDSF